MSPRVAAIAFVGGALLQLRQMGRTPDWFLAWCTTPLTTLALVALLMHAGRPDLAPAAVLAPVLMGMWSESLYVGGEVISVDRRAGRMDALLAAPAPFAAQHLGRMAMVSASSLALVPLAWVPGSLLLGRAVPVAHPALFAAALLLTAFAMCGMATLMSCVFVLARSARTVQNALSYPFFVLGGVLVPVSLLPAWVELPSSLFFLSWSGDLLRDALSATDVEAAGWRLAALAGLALGCWAIGCAALARTLRVARRTGEVGHA
ncbi:ABC transporter permease [Agrococcus sp. HG114]|uniref:ABC transporter permease n=1 Tax=Agrococcus sp. HG114 TaxID=2969757 RepID=UPI00215A5824|nr:ABC transporter permease [Agrococcus sp. HG114]MCR8671352.1 ABC transporter permease [Agrococcus sp. HG114]